jgi:hypothetical protein
MIDLVGWAFFRSTDLKLTLEMDERTMSRLQVAACAVKVLSRSKVKVFPGGVVSHKGTRIVMPVVPGGCLSIPRTGLTPSGT